MLKYLLLGFALFALNCLDSYAQVIVGENIDRDISNNSYFKHYGIGTFDDRDKSAIGSPYIFPEFQQGKIKLKGNSGFYEGQYEVQYDLMKHIVYILRKGEIVGIDGANLDVMIVNKESERQTFHAFSNEDFDPELLELLVDGQYKFWRGYHVDLIEPTYNVALDVGSINPEYVKTAYFKVSQEDTFELIPEKRKQIKNMKMQQLAKELEQGVDRNKALLQDMALLTKFFMLFNESLVKDVE